jgi:hypothetical protein
MHADTFVVLDHLIDYVAMKHEMDATDVDAPSNADADSGS